VCATPNASVDRIDGAELRDDGSCVLRVRVKAVPDKGKANKAVIAILAKSLGVPKSAFTLIRGETARQKTITVAANPAQLTLKARSLA